MNSLIKVIGTLWLIVVFLSSHIGLMVIGFALAFTEYYLIYSITPLISLSILICIIKLVKDLWSSNPVGYLEDKFVTKNK